jgi:ribonuclease/clavin/mitogillin
MSVFTGFALRTPTLPPATHTVAWRIGRLLIDPGSPWPEEQARLAPHLDGVEAVLLTHHHPDHTGGVADVVARTGAKVWAHADARLGFPVDRHLHDDEQIDSGEGVVRCLHTPGHADGHLAFLHEPTGDVVVGDLVAGIGTVVLPPPDGHLGRYLESLERLVGLTRRALPAHGPVLEDGAGALRALIAHRHARTEQLRAALAAGAASPEELVGRVYGTRGDIDARLAAQQLGTHLQWLAERGEAHRLDGARWALTPPRAAAGASLERAAETLARLIGETTRVDERPAHPHLRLVDPPDDPVA